MGPVVPIPTEPAKDAPPALVMKNSSEAPPPDAPAIIASVEDIFTVLAVAPVQIFPADQSTAVQAPLPLSVGSEQASS